VTRAKGENQMHEDKERPFKHGSDTLAQYENEQRRDTYGPDHGSGDPHMNWDDKPLKESKVWQSHRSAKPKK